MKQGTDVLDIPVNFMGEDFIASVVFRVTYRGCEAKVSGPPEFCYPAEAAEWETDAIFLYRDIPPAECRPAMFEAKGSLFRVLEDCATIRERIEEYIGSEESGW